MMGALCSGGPAADDAVEVRAQVIAEVTNAYEEKITALEKEIAALKAKLPSAASEEAAGSGVAAVRSRSASSKHAPAQRDDAGSTSAHPNAGVDSPKSSEGQPLEDAWTTSAWLSSLGVAKHVAGALLGGGGEKPADELAAMRAFGKEASEQTIADRLHKNDLVSVIAKAVLPELQQLAAALRGKFVQEATAVGGSMEGQDAPPSVQLRLDVEHGLEAHDFTDLWREKHGAHLPGTREWAFKEIFAWLDAAPTDAAQLFWLMGGGGVGKSVLTAELLRRAYGSNRVVAWHFCRHDNPQQSSPDALLRSLAAMLCARLPGYKEALGEVASELRKSADPKELFAALFAAPLQKVKSPTKPSFIILDALDELPKQGQKPLLSVIAAQLSTLPPWLRLFVTSREEPQIKAALAKFEPKELRADEAKNRADVEVRLGATP